jgi:dimethylamine monooxygenase subunit B
VTGSTSVGLIPVRVSRIEDLTPDVRTLRLAADDGHYLPGFSGGSHITVGIDIDDVTHLRNAYSLMSSPYDTSHYDIAVRRMESGRGGSQFLHRMREGDTLGISPPVNLFPIQIHGKLHIFIVGGIGITPVFPQDGGRFPAGALADLGLKEGDLGERKAGSLPYLTLLAGALVVLFGHFFFQLPS